MIVESEGWVRLAAFLGAFAAVAGWELARPVRRQAVPRARRWPHNLGLLLVDVALVRFAAPGAAIAVAIAGEARGWGLLNAVALPAWAGVIVGVVLLDLAIYFQHVMFHAVPTLWRLHRVHHSDVDFDLTTGVRFHPVEILLSTAIKSAAVAAIGASPLAVVLFEVLLNTTSLFNHANASLPGRLERALRLLLVTPDMHRIHHSVEYDESSSNFAFSLSLWDRLFGTYRAEPRADPATMTIGVDAFRAPGEERLDHLLVQPLRETPGRYPINRRRMVG